MEAAIRINGSTGPWRRIVYSGYQSEILITRVETGVTYDLRFRYITLDGDEGQWCATETHTVTGKDVNPAQPSDISATSLINAIRLDWTNPPDLDFDHVNIWRNTSDSFPGGNALYSAAGAPNEAISIADKNVSYGTTYYYFLKAVDAAGNLSDVTSSVNASPRKADTDDVENDAIDGDKIDNALDLNVGSAGQAYISGSDAIYRFWSGDSDPTLANFSVDKDGNLIASSATLSGEITASTGSIGGWTIGATELTSANISLDSDNDRIVVDDIIIDGANNRIRSSNYVSGIDGTGFTLEPDLLEVGNIAARGIIRTAVFQKDVVSAIGGNLAVLPADVLATDMTAADSSTLTIEGNETFSVGDLLRVKDGTDDEWLEVINTGSAPTYTVTRDKGSDYGADSNPAWKKGATVVNYGQSGDGFVYMTASETNAPYMSVITHAGSPWDTLTTRFRAGNLNGFLDYSSDLYGIAIGETDAYLKYDPTNGMRLKGSFTITGGTGALNLDDLPGLPSDENLIAYWSLDDGTGSVAVDNSGKGNDGTLLGDPQWVSGISGKCIDFDQNDYIDCGTDASLQQLTGDRTLTAWVYIEYSGWPPGPGVTNLTICTNESFQNYGFTWRLDGTTGKQYFRCSQSGSNSAAYSDTLVTSGEWHHLAVVYDSSTVTFYLDGISDGSTSVTTNITSSASFAIGYSSQGFDGLIDEVRIYNATLTANEVKALYLNPAGVSSRVAENRVYTGLDSSGNVITKVLPGENVGTPAGSGLYLGADYLGFYSGAEWTNFLKSDGSFKLGKDANNYFVYDLANFKFKFDDSDALEILDGGNIKLNAGGDIVFTSSDTNPSLLNWDDTIYMGKGADIPRGLCIWPQTASQERLQIGYDPIGDTPKYFKDIYIYADNKASIRAYDSPERAYLDLDVSGSPAWARLYVFNGIAGQDRYIKISSNSNIELKGSLYPETTKAWTLGTNTKIWDMAVLNRLRLEEITTPTASANFGQLYTKNDNKLYFQDGAGVEHTIAFA